ncbi:hypothetical protein ACX80N_12620 [Arthrobacter sp. MDT2-16]
MVGDLIKKGYDDPATIESIGKTEPLSERNARVSLIEKAHNAAEVNLTPEEAVAFSRAGVPSNEWGRNAATMPRRWARSKGACTSGSSKTPSTAAGSSSPRSGRTPRSPSAAT